MGRPSKYTEQELRRAVQKSLAFAGVLRELGLQPGGGTQANIANRIRKLGIDTCYTDITG
jgi:hypothetical protein